MKGLAITHRGFEDICSKEIFELTGAKGKALEGCVEFDIGKMEDLCLLCYRAQSVVKVLYLIDSASFSGVDSLKGCVDKIDIDEWFDKDTTFCVRCIHDDADESTQNIEATVGEFILERKKAKVSLDNPEITFFAYIINKKAYFGVDFSGMDLSKRQYKIFQHPYALKGTIAYCLYRLGDCDGVVLDPFCGSGTILIEAALHRSKFPVNYYQKDKFAFLGFKCFEGFDFDRFFERIDKEADKDKGIKLNGFDDQLRHVKASKNNAKIAGVEKQINFSRVDIEWLDTKLDKDSVDLAITNPPMITQHTSPTAIQKIYDEFFHQVEFVLKGRLVVISKNIELFKKTAARKKFKAVSERPVFSGKQEYKVVIFSK